MEEIIVVDNPDNVCFGCSPHNPQGLKLTFVRTGEKTVECRTRLKEHFCGAPGVIHGGIQAVLLDEVMGVIVHRGTGDGFGRMVTAEFQLRYRRPTRMEEELVVRAELKRVEGRNYFLEGEILDPSGERLTVAEARWVRLENQNEGPST